MITYTDITSKYLFSNYIPRKSANLFSANTIGLLSNQIKEIKFITLDNDSEMMDYKNIEKQLSTSIYFCDSGNPGQRGLNENTNGLIRQYFPKKTKCKKMNYKQLLIK